MAADKIFTIAELKALNTKDDLHMLIGGKVYAIAPFLDEHPGGDEVLFGEAGRDATEAFEDVGHSDEAREILAKYLVGSCTELATKGPSNADDSAKRGTSSASASSGPPTVLFLLPLAFFAAYLAYHFSGRS